MNLKPNSTVQMKSQTAMTRSKTEGGEISLKKLFLQPGKENAENPINNNNDPSSFEMVSFGFFVIELF